MKFLFLSKRIFHHSADEIIFLGQNFIYQTSKISKWVNNTMQWHLDGVISEDEMIAAIQFLVKEASLKFDCYFKGRLKVRLDKH